MSDDDEIEKRIELDPDSVCLACKAGLHNECDLSFTDMLEPDQPCCCRGEFSIELYRELDAGLEKILAGEPDTGGRVKSPSEVGDNTSTGRKRADTIGEMMLPVYDGKTVCAWAWLLHAGGGPIPIVGCAGNLLVGARSLTDEQKAAGLKRGDLHHGPDKNTLSNSPGVNLHRICTICHNRWHALNDPYYEDRPEANVPHLPLVPYWPHDGLTRATDEQREIAEAWQALPPAQRPEYPYIPETPPLAA